MRHLLSGPRAERRRRAIRYLVSLALVGVLAPRAADGQALGGVVIDALTLEPIVEAMVTATAADGRTVSALSRNDGSFSMSLPAPGRYSVTLRRIGYPAPDPLDIEVGQRDLLNLRLELSPSPLALDPLVVTARRRDLRQVASYEGLYARHEVTPLVGPARVMVHGDAEMAGGATLRDVLQWVASPRGCVVYFLNGLPDRQGINELELLSVDLVEGIEFYRSALGAPLDYQGGGCWEAMDHSIVAVWLRRSDP